MKFVKILNDYSNNVKVAFKTITNLIMKQISYRSKNFAKISPCYDNSGIIYKLKCNNDTFYTSETNKNFKTRYKEHIFKIKL